MTNIERQLVNSLVEFLRTENIYASDEQIHFFDDGQCMSPISKDVFAMYETYSIKELGFCLELNDKFSEMLNFDYYNEYSSLAGRFNKILDKYNRTFEFVKKGLIRFIIKDTNKEDDPNKNYLQFELDMF